MPSYLSITTTHLPITLSSLLCITLSLTQLILPHCLHPSPLLPGHCYHFAITFIAVIVVAMFDVIVVVMFDIIILVIVVYIVLINVLDINVVIIVFFVAHLTKAWLQLWFLPHTHPT